MGSVQPDADLWKARSAISGRPSRHLDANIIKMAKVRITLTIDELLLRAVKVRAARTGLDDSEVIEQAVRRDLGFDLLERMWERNDLAAPAAIDLAVEAQHKTRRRRR